MSIVYTVYSGQGSFIWKGRGASILTNEGSLEIKDELGGLIAAFAPSGWGWFERRIVGENNDEPA